MEYDVVIYNSLQHQAIYNKRSRFAFHFCIPMKSNVLNVRWLSSSRFLNSSGDSPYERSSLWNSRAVLIGRMRECYWAGPRWDKLIPACMEDCYEWSCRGDGWTTILLLSWLLPAGSILGLCPSLVGREMCLCTVAQGNSGWRIAV